MDTKDGEAERSEILQSYSMGHEVLISVFDLSPTPGLRLVSEYHMRCVISLLK